MDGLSLMKRRDCSVNQVALGGPPGISASPSEENMRYFNVMILGPAQSPYEGGVFKLELFLPEEYPMAAPKKHQWRAVKRDVEEEGHETGYEEETTKFNNSNSLDEYALIFSKTNGVQHYKFEPYC
ncbi:hypothetical protein ZIOFF_047517 [Zingiber officinale]|uniref:UBC core domain-containing protein n=1 Tax=Zingiber officinale TaxID=94328 RepID=A0A8J5FQZ4_ZINOF|nr:hypothetical protein ZIOFF_047517 [Zingiber officinale]